MEDIIDIIVTETTNLIEITSQPTDEIIDVNIIDNREDVTLNVTPTLVEININSLTGNFGINWGEITGTLSNQTDLQNALNLKADLVGGKVPSSQLPSYVDDVVEVATYSALPATGETGKIYVTIDTNYIYRWTGSVYVEIKDSSAVWGAITGTLSSQTDLQNALNAKDAVLTFNSPLSRSTNTVSIPQATATINGYLSSADWTTFNAKQAALSGTGFVKISGTTISYDNSTYLTGSGSVGYMARWSSAGVLTDSFVSTASNITTVEGMGLSTLNGIDIQGNYGAGGGGLKIRSYDETTGNAYIDFANTGGRMYLGLNKSTSGGLMTNASAYATVLTTGLGTANLEFGTNATKRVTIDGTTGAVTLTSALSGTSASFTSSATATAFIPTSSSIPTNGMYLSATNTLGFATNSTIAFSINSNGQSLFNKNLGIGVIPTSWTTSTNVIQLGIGGAVSSRSAVNNLQLSSNYYRSAALTNLYINSDFATLYEQSSGAHTFYTSSSGTAGSAISFSNVFNIAQSGAATFSSSVNVGNFLTVSAASTLLAPSSGKSIEMVYRTDGTNDYAFIQAYDRTAGAFKRLDLNSAVTILPSGNVGIGNTTGPEKLSVNGNLILLSGYQIYGNSNSGSTSSYLSMYNGIDGGIDLMANYTTSKITFGTAGSERMRITSGGQVGINTASFDFGERLGLYSTTSYTLQSKRSGTGSEAHFAFSNANGAVGSIFTNGSTTFYNATSDYRLKQDLKPIKGLEIVSKIKVYDYEWKSNNTRMDGVLAHELAEVLPYAVTGVKDGEQMQSVDYSKIVPVMVQAIKDLKSELDTYTGKNK